MVAEGVENEALMNRLKDLRCDLAQGYHLSRPLPPAKLELWLKGWQLENRLNEVMTEAGHVKTRPPVVT